MQFAAIGAFAVLAATGTLLRWCATGKTIFWSSPATGLSVVNLTGAFFAGLLYNIDWDINDVFVTALVAGGIGALTTVSGLARQVARMAQANRWLSAGYLAALIAGGIVVAWLGMQLTGAS